MTDIELKTLKDNLWHSADMLRAGADNLHPDLAPWDSPYESTISPKVYQ